MMWHRRFLSLLGLFGGLVLGPALSAVAQDSAQPPAARTKPTAPPSVEQALLQALAANPVTAPYRFSVAQRDGRHVLRGRVGTKQIHDVAVQIAVALGHPISDEIVIDTAEAYRGAALASGAVGPIAAGALSPLAGAVGPLVAAPFGLNSFIYPPPLLGRYDDPFLGLEPPVISYPPWWRSIANRQPLDPSIGYPVPPVGSVTQQAAKPVGNTPAQPSPSHSQGALPPEGTIEMTIDQRGVAVLRGTVLTLSDRIAIGQRIAQTPGIVEVQNLLSVREADSTGPPPPPEPAKTPVKDQAPAPAQPAPAEAKDAKAQAAIPVDETGLSQRMASALARRPALAELPIQVKVRAGVAYISGRLPSVYEAMLAYRVAQQTPGVRDVVDRLEFVVPDSETKNPLLQKGRPEDVEPYLEAQVRRQLGDLAHVDRIRLQGDRLEIHGTIVRADDRTRIEAILRSMAILRGFRLVPDFQPE